MSDDEGRGAGAGGGSPGKKKASRFKELQVAPGEEKSGMLDLSESGRFIDGQLIISPAGLTVAASPGMPETTTFNVCEDDFLELEVCGKGSSSVVRKAILRRTNQLMALKAISVYDADLRKQLLNEIKHLFGAEVCSQMIKFHGAYFREGHIVLALEYATAGSLQDVLAVCGRIDEEKLAFIMHQILKGLNFMHKQRHLIHRDLKPANLLFDHSGRVLLTDFGVSRALDETLEKCQTFVGTFHYFSPERFVGEVYSYASDIWAVGIMAVECATGVFPFRDCKGYWELLNAATTEAPPNVPEGEGSEDLRHFISLCLVRDPAMRATAEALLHHPFITRNCDAHSKGARASAIATFVSDLCSVFTIAKADASANEIGFQFLHTYFSLMKNQRRFMASLYNDDSVLKIDADQHLGRGRIMSALMTLDCELLLDPIRADDELAGTDKHGNIAIVSTGTVASEAGRDFRCEFTLAPMKSVPDGRRSFVIALQVLRLR